MRESLRSHWIRILFLFFLFPHVAISTTFLLGIDVFVKGYTHLVKGHRVGLITNQTGWSKSGEATVDLLSNHPDVNLVVLFAPEHGIRGKLKAGEIVPETTDTKTGLPILSLYGGDDHRPPKIGLNMIDTLIYDIQDVGSRAYTYIWSMAEAMAAVGEAGKNFIVLDRPNPLSCSLVDGPITEDKWLSFIGLYPIPRVYGMTVGELARYLNREHRLNCNLTIIPMAGYNRNMTWESTNTRWVPPSPNIPTLGSARCFASTGTIGVLGNVHIGISTQYPFQMFGAPWLDHVHAASYLNQCGLTGIEFRAFQFQPKEGLFAGRMVNAVMLNVSNAHTFFPATTELRILGYLQRFYPDQFKWIPEKFKGFDKAMGTSKVRVGISNGESVEEIARSWEKDLALFQTKISSYLIYR